MYFILGLSMALLGAIIYAAVFWKNSSGMEQGKRIVFVAFGFTVVIYQFVLYVAGMGNKLDISAMGLSYFFAGIAFMFVDIGRSFVAPKIANVLSKDKKAFAISDIHITLFETNAIYTLLVFVLGMTIVREDAMSYSLMNTAMMYVSLFAAIAALLMGVVMNRALEGVESFEDMRGRFQKTIMWTVSAHSVAIIGLVLAIYTLLPYMGE